MKIVISPEDIIKRCAWDSYVYYIVGSDKEAREILEKNEEVEISERDALVIGLLKVIETTNLIHKFNNYIVELLTNKSIRQKDLLIKKKVFDYAFDKFLNKFPVYWEPSTAWLNSLSDLREYTAKLRGDIDKLEIREIEDKNMIMEYYSSNSVKKLLKFNY